MHLQTAEGWLEHTRQLDAEEIMANCSKPQEEDEGLLTCIPAPLDQPHFFSNQSPAGDIHRCDSS